MHFIVRPLFQACNAFQPAMSPPVSKLLACTALRLRLVPHPRPGLKVRKSSWEQRSPTYPYHQMLEWLTLKHGSFQCPVLMSYSFFAVVVVADHWRFIRRHSKQAIWNMQLFDSCTKQHIQCLVYATKLRWQMLPDNFYPTSITALKVFSILSSRSLISVMFWGEFNDSDKYKQNWAFFDLLQLWDKGNGCKACNEPGAH